MISNISVNNNYSNVVYRSKLDTINSQHNYFAKQTKDSISFSGLNIKPTKNKDEIKAIIDLFYESLLEGVHPNKKSNKFLNKIEKYILTRPFILMSKSDRCITEIAKVDEKLAGGYSIVLNPKDSSAHLGFITLAPQYKRTRTGVDILRQIAQKICKNMEENNIQKLTFSTNSKNTPINRLLKRLDAEPVKKITSETEYQISLEQLKNKLGF